MEQDFKDNLFTYTKKELEQDALIRWLLENSSIENGETEANDLAYFGRKLIKKIIKEATNEDIVFETGNWIKTVGQAVSIDVFVIGKFGKNYYKFVIEDKTFSFIHDDQLEKYLEKADGWYKYDKKETSQNTIELNDSNIERRDDYKTIPVYLKTSLIRNDERKNVKKQVAEFCHKRNIKPVILDLKDWANIFFENKEIDDIKNPILKDYLKTLKTKADNFITIENINKHPIILSEYKGNKLNKYRLDMNDLTIERQKIFFYSLFHCIH